MYCKKLNDFLKMNQQQPINRQKFKGKASPKNTAVSHYIYIYYSDTRSIFFDTHKSLVFQWFYAPHFYNFYNQVTLSIVLQGENNIWILKN